jgi:L-threonylcarbamoyladenylate synthase
MSLTLEDAKRLQECLAGDGVAIVPTDTVYGLACNPESETALRRVYELKGRPPLKPVAVMFFALQPALDCLAKLLHTGVAPRTRAALGALLPGPVTVLLANPERRFPLACDPGDLGSAPLGLRVPALQGASASLTAVRVPAAQSSANRSGNADPRSVQEVPAALREGVDLVLDGGELPGAASTVLDLSGYEQAGSWQVVREGPIQRSSLERLLG